MRQAIENIFSEIAQIFLEFYSGNFQLDLGSLGKFLLADKVLRFMPYIRAKKAKVEKKMTIKGMIDMNLRKLPISSEAKHAVSNVGSFGAPYSSPNQHGDSILQSEQRMKQSHDLRLNSTPEHQGQVQQFSQMRSVFQGSPTKRSAPPPAEDLRENNLMFGAGTDPLALNQNYSMFASNPNNLMGTVFSKPPYARIRCPPVIDLFSRTQAAPVASQYNSLSASSRIGLFYSIATKYLYFDPESNEICYLKIKENKTKLTANEELLKAMATEHEEIRYLLDPDSQAHLHPKIEAKLNCYRRYREYIEREIPMEIVAPIRQYWITNVLDLIPANQKDLDQSEVERIIDHVLTEINSDYYNAVKKSILDYILKEDSEKLRIGILQRFDEPIEYGEDRPRGVIADQFWVDKVERARDEIKKRVVNYNHATLSIIALWQEISKNKFFKLPHPDDPKEIPNTFINKQKQNIRDVQETIKTEWISAVARIYQNELGSMENSEIARFFTATRTLMSSQLRDLIYSSLSELREFVGRFERQHYLSPKECISNDMDRTKPLQKSFLVVKIEKTLKFSENPDSIRAEILKLVDDVVSSSENIPLPQNKIANVNQKTLCSVHSKDDEVVNEVRRHIDRVITDNMAAFEKVLEIFSPFKHLLTEATKLETILKTPATLKEYERMIQGYKTIAQKVEDDIPFEIYMGMVLVDCRDAREELLRNCEELVDKILSKIDENMKNLNVRVGEDTKNMFDLFDSKNSTRQLEADYFELCDKRKDAIDKTEKKKMITNFKEVTEMLWFLYKYRYNVEVTVLTSINATASSVDKIDEELKRARDGLASMKEQIKKKLSNRKELFEQSLKTLEENLKTIKSYGIEDVETAMGNVRKMDELVNDCVKESKEINHVEDKIREKRTAFELLEKTIALVEPFRDFWNVVDRYSNEVRRWMEKEPVLSLDYSEVMTATKQMNGTIASVLVRFEAMEEKPDKALKETKELIKKLKAFTDKSPLINALASKSMQDRHWKEVNELLERNGITDMPWSDSATWKLLDCDKNGLSEHKQKLLEISEKSEREYKNFKQLEEMVAEWEGVTINLKGWKETNSFVIVGDSVDTIQAILDDHIIKTQTMKGSQFAKIFDARINKWETDLIYLRDTLDVWLKVQANWIYLQPIFASPDIKRELPNEEGEFSKVNSRWKDIMTHTSNSANSKAMGIPRDLTLKDTLKGMLERLEGVQEKLLGYLNMKRSKFPRFYFLSEDSLIEVLSEARDATKIQKYCKVLFEGIKVLDFSKDDVILGLKSSEGEVIKFETPIPTRSHLGLVEAWLQILEDTMVVEIRRNIEEAFGAFEKMPREEFVLGRMGQGVLNVDMTIWTLEAEKAIREGRDGLPKFLRKLDQELQRIVLLIKKNIAPLDRCTLEALIVLDVHNKEVIKDLIEARVTSVTDFDYEAQLRYYWDMKPESKQMDTIVKMVNTTLDYNYEYLGNSARLVITPLTDRCYRTLCGAIGLNYGGAPEGPAGTGKTETVKDLAKALARMIVVFNCTGGITYKYMERFFKGLCSTGGWSCLDEFNRIDLEVLSVIAQQLQCIQNAIKESKTSFEFAGTVIRLKPTCNSFITMNPGYAGRSELPDNLKALFRSVAMMVPDYALIGEIRLYSFGFIQAQSLAKKIVTTYKLCSEQISAQKHYDYGMRAVNSVLLAAGNLRKAAPNGEEDVQILRAINEVNEAKFLNIDLPLFKAITQDLFPETRIPEIDLAKLMDCLKEVIAKKGLQEIDYFLDKIVQVYQMILVRHGLMVVGEPYGGKSTALDVLAEALGLMHDKHGDEMHVETIYINPKSITNAQLYGASDKATGEWTDGVLPAKFKKMANDETNMRRWLCFDGPVDAVWIEDMNTVLDDNKKLCLSNGDIYYMSSVMNLIFEPMDLLVASPATVSRCGMIFIEPHIIGWMHLYKSWKLTLPSLIQPFEKDEMDLYFSNIFTPLIKQFERGVFEVTAPTMVQNVVCTLLKLATPYFQRFENKEFYEAMEFKERRSYFDKVFTFATIWSLGATLTVEHRQKFDSTFKKLINSPDSSLDQELAKKHRKIELPEGGSGRVFESTLDVRFETLDDGEKKVYLRWVKWSDLPRNSTQEFGNSMQPNEIIVNTVDLVRYTELIEAYIQNSCHVLICGPTGTGKTIYIKRIISSLNKATNQSLEIGFSAQTTASQVQEIIDTNIIRRSKGVYGPPPKKKLVIFVDDLGMPKKETYGAQPPIELLRQMIGRGGWYDLTEKPKPFKTIQDVVFLAAMGQPGSGRNEITPRFQRLMSLISFTTIDDQQMELIFKTILSWRFTSGGFNEGIGKLAIPVVKATLAVYTQVTGYFKPLPSKSHYLFNLRDFAKVIFGICMGDSDKIKTKEMLTKLWIHEVWRVFGDRLNTEKDRLYLLNEIIKKTTHKAMGENMDNLLVNLDKDGDNKIETLEEIRGLIFTDVMSATSLKVRPYEIVVEYSNLTRACESALTQYDMANEDKPLNIVLFGFAIEHLLIISRILKQPGGNALLVGIGGSGRQCLTKLAAKIADHHLFQIELSKNYGVPEWKDDLKKALKMAGGKAESSIFLFRDSQIKYESFIEDINNLLNNGEVPNLFPPEERGELLELSRKNAKDNNKEGVESPEQLMALFTETVKKKLHVVLCFSPIGSNFRNKIRMFPSLVNCCTLDWFFEWPEEALFTVASKFVGQTSLKDTSVKEKCVEMVKFFHIDTQKWAADFLKQLKRQYYVTPTSFIDMINQFKSLLVEKTDAVSSMQQKYENGYKMIIEAESSVESIKAQLKELAPQLEVAQQRGEVIAAETEEKKKEAEVVSTVVAEEKTACEAIASDARAISDECREEMSAVIPEIKRAGEKLDQLDDKDFVMLKGNKVPMPLLLTSQCLAIVLKQPEEKIKNEQTMKIETDWRRTTQKLYTRSAKEICQDMKDFNNADFNNLDFEKDIEVLDEKTYQKIKKLFEENPTLLNEEAIKRSSEACANIFTWIEVQLKLQPMELGARPKRQKFKIAKAQLDEAEAKLKSKVKQLQDKQDELSMYTKRLNETIAENQRLKKEFETCKLKLERSEILIENLRDEKDRWRDLSEILKLDLDNLVGDVLVSSAVISYLGPFTSGFRSQINKSWSAKARELKLPGSDEMSLVKTFGDPVQIRNWQIKELPSDDFSTENAIILNKSRRWSLCIDPQIQANKWIKNMESEKLIITNLANNFFMRDLERAIRMGLPCLLENVGEEIDAALDPILLKQIQGQGTMATIKLGEKTVDYIHSFFLYVTTKERNPHYLPEVSTKVTIINFMITSEGLSDQLLGIIVKAEMPKKEEEKVRLITEGAQNKEELRRQENQILRILEQPKDKLLDDETAINALTMCKKKSNEISEKQKIAEVTEREINEARKNYEDISRTGSCLFFAISDLGFIDPMYQYSLTYYIDLFKNAINKAEPADKHSEVQERLPKIEAYFLYSLYLNISRSLFVKDKLLLSFLLSIRLKQFRGEIAEGYYGFFLTGSVGKPANLITMPSSVSWMNKSIWENICRLSEFKNFDGIHRSFESMFSDWNRIYDSQDPVNEPLPALYEQTLNHFEKMLIVKILRPDKLVPYVQQYVIQSLGRKFVEIPAFDLEAVYLESTKISPLIFVLTPGVDPYNMLKQFADKKGVGLEGISLGQGQGEIALKKIEEASDKDKPGFWVVLQNCHLAETFMNPLEKKCDEISMNPGKINENFRLWLTSYPSKLFPSSILQNGVKMTNEPPSGLKNNLKSALMNDEISNPNNFNKSENLTAYRRLVFGLCFFHSVIQERRKFGPLGWNIPYEFTESDLRISAAQLRIFINKYKDELPLPALKYLTAECNYGGRVTDDKDRRLIKVILEDYYNKDVAMYERHELAPPAQEYYIPNGNNFNDFVKYVDDLPLNTPPGVYGFHSNANITKELNETGQLVDTLLLCQGGGSSKGGEDTNEMLKFINKIIEECPKNFNDAEAREKYPAKKEESMNIILIQELNRFNKLISTIRSSLGNIRDAMTGLIVFSFELEETLNFIRINKVPKAWMENSYPSLKPLPAYMEDLAKRVEFFAKWVAEGKPPVFWISRFFFPQGFLTGIQQNYARKYGIAIDKLIYDFEVLPKDQEVLEPAEDGAFVQGFFLEGAKFDYNTMALGESDPKILFVEGPRMYFKPIRSDEPAPKKKGFEYECPLYRTGDRRGVLMTTGHSTNFVMLIKIPSEYEPRHWIKRGVAAITQLND